MGGIETGIFYFISTICRSFGVCGAWLVGSAGELFGVGCVRVDYLAGRGGCDG